MKHLEDNGTAQAKGTNQCSIPLPPISSSSPLDSIARVCGFSLGIEESTRLANISLIQAKEEAVKALLDTKAKLCLSSEVVGMLGVRDNSPSGSSVDHQSPCLDGKGDSAGIDLILLPDDLGWNIRGLGNAGRRKLLIELVNKHSFDCICLQETIRT